jgi:hypothetical protein
MSRDAKGVPVEIMSPKCETFCLFGAIAYCYPNEGEMKRIIGKTTQRIGYCIEHWNDNPKRTFEEVQALIKELDI